VTIGLVYGLERLRGSKWAGSTHSPVSSPLRSSSISSSRCWNRSGSN